MRQNLANVPMRFGVRLLGFVLVSGVLPGAAQAAPEGKVVHLPPVEVTGSREEDFVLRMDKIPSSRIWLLTAGKGLLSTAPRYHGRGLKSGDEIISIDGQRLSDMAPGAALREFHRFSAFAAPGLRRDSMDLEVRGAGDKALRKVKLARTEPPEAWVEKPKEDEK